MKTKMQTKAKASSWKDAKIVELSIGELACAAGGRRIILIDPECGCKSCKQK